MEYVGIWFIIIVAIAVGIILYSKFKKKNTIYSDAIGNINATAVNEKIKCAETDNEDELEILIEKLSVDVIEDKSKLVEITDSKILAYINKLVPELAQVSKAVMNTIQSGRCEKGNVLYRAIIPSGTNLASSKDMKGALRGFFYDVDGIKGHANFVPDKVHKRNRIFCNKAEVAWGIASMIVGSYYMTQINSKLSIISDGISQIQYFQNNEYIGNVLSLVTHVKNIADFQVEILDNNELRFLKISQLDRLEENCTKLLAHANITLNGFTNKNELEYEEYEKELGNAQNWFMYQKTLLDVLYKISDLRYTLNFGSVTREQCNTLLSTYSKQVNDIQMCLADWHNETVKRLGIDINETRRKRVGLDGVVHFIPGLFNDNLNFCSIELKTASMIQEQSSRDDELYKYDTSELYNKDVQLISKDGKIYYLP